MDLRIAIFQQNIIWEDIKSNQALIEDYLIKTEKEVDIVVLPEMFLTGFSMNIESNSISMDSEIIIWLVKLSEKHKKAILGTLAIKENNCTYNRALFVAPDGNIQLYDKRHLFRMGREDEFYKSGSERKIIEYKGFKILLQICYDLRFPVFSRNCNDYDMIVYMANWPESRKKVWKTLLKARAIENQSYVVGVNRVGKGGGISYSGNSCVIDYKGDKILNCKSKNNAIKSCVLSLKNQHSFKQKFPTYLDADKFKILN